MIANRSRDRVWSLDDTTQLAAAKRLIRRCISESQALFVPVTVALELEWALRASFEYTKDEVMEVLSSLFSAAELTFESERGLEVALQLYREGSGDFADCLHVALAAQAGELPCGRSTGAPPRSTGHSR